MEAFLRAALLDAPATMQQEVAALNSTDFESRTVGRFRLPVDDVIPEGGSDFVVSRCWSERLRGAYSTLTFTCLNRLAELAIRTNPQLRRALRVTYPFVFVDEFQDTTHAQYDFLSSVFSDSGARITAVGDDKQRIMTWAGAQEDALSQFEADFTAHRIQLVLNHRSSPGLVHVQQVVARAIDPAAADIESKVSSEIGADIAQVWNFSTPEDEASMLADWLKHDMADRRNIPRDYALLVRQKADDFEEQLRRECDKQGIRLRNENRVLGRITLQNLLVEESTRIALAVLRLGAHTRAPEAWTLAAEALIRLRAIDPVAAEMSLQVQEELTAFIRMMRGSLQGTPTSEAAGVLVDHVFEFLDTDAMRRAYTEYGGGDRLEIAIEAFRLQMQASADASRHWVECLDLFDGQDSIPLMTVHKSKGLEYDTIVFMGLDDESWWSHQAGDLEGRSTFFVALSRAKQRVIFTYSRGRARRQVADLYQLLISAGVPEVVYA